VSIELTVSTCSRRKEQLLSRFGNCQDCSGDTGVYIRLEPLAEYVKWGQIAILIIVSKCDVSFVTVDLIM
jgi:hypothetical protein